MRIWAIGGAMVLALAGTMPAGAQSSDFEREVLRRLERLERRMDDLERRDDRNRVERGRDDRGGFSGGFGRPPARDEVVAAVSLLCGANCGMAAQSYCRQTGYRNGVAVTIEKKGAFDHVTRARCFN